MQVDENEGRLLKLLMENKHANVQDIISHKWCIVAGSNDELWLRCKECEFYYSVSAFSNGSVIRFFVSDVKDKESMSVMSCEACKMHNAIG